MSSTIRLPAFALAIIIGLGHGATHAHAGRSTMTGYGQSPVQLTAADQARSGLLRQTRFRSVIPDPSGGCAAP